MKKFFILIAVLLKLFIIFALLKTFTMGKRKIFERQIVDAQTGELLTDEAHFIQNNNETFGMHRTTEGLNWLMGFTGNEIKMLILLLEIEDIKSGIVSMTVLTRKHLQKVFGKSHRYIQMIISELEAKNGLFRITQSDIVLNPFYFYKGGTKILKERYAFYKSARAKGASVSDEFSSIDEFE